MKITLSKSQWQFIGKKAGWTDFFKPEATLDDGKPLVFRFMKENNRMPTIEEVIPMIKELYKGEEGLLRNVASIGIDYWYQLGGMKIFEKKTAAMINTSPDEMIARDIVKDYYGVHNHKWPTVLEVVQLMKNNKEINAKDDKELENIANEAIHYWQMMLMKSRVR